MSLFHRLAYTVLAFAVLGAVCPFTMAQGQGTPPKPYEATWLSAGQAFPAPRIELDVSAPSETLCGAPLYLECVIQTQSAYAATVVRTHVLDSAGAVQSVGETALDLVPGANKCTVEWDACDLPVGEYRVVVEVDYATGAPRARYEIPLLRVSGADLASRLDQAAVGHAALLEALASEPSDGLSYAMLRLHVVAAAIDRARHDYAASQWEALCNNLDYIERTLPAINAQLAFGAVAPERQGSLVRPSSDALHLAHGGFIADGRPTYLFGATLATADVGQVARIARYGLNFAALVLPPRVTLAGPDGASGFASAYDELFAALAAEDIAVAARLAPHDVPSWVRERYPDLTDKGFVDLTHTAMDRILSQHYRAALPYLASKPGVLGVALVEDPKFRFDTEATRLAFVDQVRALYPDRQLLNRTWDAHFGDYDEIGIWGNYPGYAHLDMKERTEDWRYQSNSAYQFDWQSFHQARGRAFLMGLMDEARALAGGLPLSVTVSEHVFEEGQTRMGLDREGIAAVTDWVGATAAGRPEDRFFAMRYPMPFAFYALMRTYNPDAPMLNLDARLLDKTMEDMPALGRYAHSMVWESVMSGLGGMALPADSLIFDHPEALEGFATAAMDVNRLAPLVRAFQQQPGRVGVLFSGSAAILRDGVPHLSSARDAFEGASFSGYPVRFVTEAQCTPEVLSGLDVMVIPETPSLSEAAFTALTDYINDGAVTVRLGTPVPYTERGASRTGVLPTTSRTIMVRGLNLPTEYLHAMDAAISLGSLPATIRAVNSKGYPLEGVLTRHITFEGAGYLYLLNLRKEPVVCHLTGNAREGRDLIQGRTVRFPLFVDPLETMLIRLEQPTFRMELAEGPATQP